MTTRASRAHPAPRAVRHGRHRDDRGVSMIEFAGYLPVLLVIGLAAIQLGLIGYGVNQAGTAARAAARVASQQGGDGNGDGNGAGIAAASGWLDPDPSVQRGADTTTASVTVHVPAVVPLFDDFDITRTATMPTDD
ncbi:putative septum site-determining protein [Streptomyces griseoaurantiacus M045]|uniref:Putative septum site-determining protein n=1 Tax=Streptomyces griseoaurantiacus M045 TaxID=996637 RepID=F3NC75_9ACTN|nr:TadE/TadG family type IV pilus assembly protein [Streptomyces griseoaurantiacus]EGG48963.1 putative septum site-determining protein [Streptomyces griseoaurantiacus M045]